MPPSDSSRGPTSPSDSSRIASGSNAWTLEGGRPPRILVADDDRVARDMLAEMLRRAGYLVECVEDERARFYHGMSAAARDEDARALFRQFADRDEAHLKFLRTASLSE